MRVEILELVMTDEISVGSLSRVALIFETRIKTKWERMPTDFVTEVTGRGQKSEGLNSFN